MCGLDSRQPSILGWKRLVHGLSTSCEEFVAFLNQLNFRGVSSVLLLQWPSFALL